MIVLFDEFIIGLVEALDAFNFVCLGFELLGRLVFEFIRVLLLGLIHVFGVDKFMVVHERHFSNMTRCSRLHSRLRFRAKGAFRHLTQTSSVGVGAGVGRPHDLLGLLEAHARGYLRPSVLRVLGSSVLIMVHEVASFVGQFCDRLDPLLRLVLQTRIRNSNVIIGAGAHSVHLRSPGVNVQSTVLVALVAGVHVCGLGRVGMLIDISEIIVLEIVFSHVDLSSLGLLHVVGLLRIKVQILWDASIGRLALVLVLHGHFSLGWGHPLHVFLPLHISGSLVLFLVPVLGGRTSSGIGGSHFC
mmetsp:Transcript_12309/g.19093  ORF Transcript_12309/g.19093 Transcript_12309/m.19093 type:complete len:301 (-) Transcript_12309:10-912(-)